MLKDKKYYDNLDKRSKEYRNYKKNFDEQNSVGVGDAVESFNQSNRYKAIN